MAYRTCPDCGERVYSLGCVNCNEAAYIEEQDRLTDLIEPEPAFADDLFVNGSGEQAARLVLTSADGRDLGGWGKLVVLDKLNDALAAQSGAGLAPLVLALLENNGGPTGGDSYEGEPDTHVLVKLADFNALHDAVGPLREKLGELLDRLTAAAEFIDAHAPTDNSTPWLVHRDAVYDAVAALGGAKRS